MQKRTDQNRTSPLDRLIRLIAEIEVEEYLKQARKKGQRSEEGDHEGSHLRTL